MHCAPTDAAAAASVCARQESDPSLKPQWQPHVSTGHWHMHNLATSTPCHAFAPRFCLQERLLEELQSTITESHMSAQRAARILLQQLVPGSLGRSARRSGQSCQVLTIPNLDDRGVWLQAALDALLVTQHSRQHYEERRQQQLQLMPPPGERRSAEQC